MLCPCKVTVKSHFISQAERIQQTFSQQEVMSVEDESTSCYCLLDPFACYVLLDSFGTYALTGEPITDCAVKQLKVAVFGCMSCNSLDYNLRVYCVDNTPCAFQVSLFSIILPVVSWKHGVSWRSVSIENLIAEGLENEPTSLARWGNLSRNKSCVTMCPTMCRGYKILASREKG